MTAVAALRGPYLSYWVARATGTPANQVVVVERQVCVASDRPITENWPREKVCYADSWEHAGPLLDQYEVIIARGQETSYDMVFEFPDSIPSRGQRRDRKYAIAHCVGNEVRYQGDTALEASMRAIVGSVYGARVPALVSDGKGNEMAPEALNAA